MTPLVRRWFVAAWRDRPGLLVYLCAMSVLNALLVTSFPWLWQYVVDAVRGGTDAPTLGKLGLALFVAGAAQSACYALLQGARTLANAVIQRNTRTITFAHLVHLPDASLRKWAPGDLLTRLTDDAGDKTAWFLCSGVFRALEAVLIVVVSFGAMCLLDPWLAIESSAPLPVLVVAQAVLNSLLARRFARVQVGISAMNEELDASFSGIRPIRAAALEPSAQRRFRASSEEVRRAEFGAAIVNQAVMLMYGYGWTLAVAVLIAVGAPRVIAGDLTVGQLVALEGLLMSMVWPMFDVGMFVSKGSLADVGLGRLEALFAEAVDPVPSHPVAPASASIELRGATVGARLIGVDLSVAPGELVVVTGEVGSGKSTLSEVLAGSLPFEGSLVIGGVNIATIDREALAASFAWVPQDPVLLSTTVRDNITLGRVVTVEDLDRAVTIAQLKKDLPQLGKGLDTEIGERGVALSGGQQQRVALARALVGRPKILLLDDATAALDADTEAAFWEALEPTVRDAATIVITHRPATLERADRVVVLEGGRVAQVGRHADLVSVPGLYQRMLHRP